MLVRCILVDELVYLYLLRFFELQIYDILPDIPAFVVLFCGGTNFYFVLRVKIKKGHLLATLCDPVGTRTRNRLLRRQMLYPVELPDQPLMVQS